MPLGTINYGYGNNGSEFEGARKNNMVFTNCLGPLFVKNPWWTEEILKDAYLRKQNKIFSRNEYDIENKSFETTKRFINEKPKIRCIN
jgi:CobQ-like glutamine amidotransferase family enzyme